MSDDKIAKRLSRDRSSITHMLEVVECLREVDAIDDWLNALTANPIGTTQAPPELLATFAATMPDSYGGVRPSPAPPAKPSKPLPARAIETLAPIATQADLAPHATLTRQAPSDIRQAAMCVLYQARFRQRQIAQWAGVSRSRVSQVVGLANKG
jgi:hypothetical protein